MLRQVSVSQAPPVGEAKREWDGRRTQTSLCALRPIRTGVQQLSNALVRQLWQCKAADCKNGCGDGQCDGCATGPLCGACAEANALCGAAWSQAALGLAWGFRHASRSSGAWNLMSRRNVVRGEGSGG